MMQLLKLIVLLSVLFVVSCIAEFGLSQPEFIRRYHPVDYEIFVEECRRICGNEFGAKLNIDAEKRQCECKDGPRPLVTDLPFQLDEDTNDEYGYYKKCRNDCARDPRSTPFFHNSRKICICQASSGKLVHFHKYI